MVPCFNSGVRVEAVCMATGQVAGCAAAVAAREGTLINNVSLETLREELITLGAIVPQ